MMAANGFLLDGFILWGMSTVVDCGRCSLVIVLRSGLGIPYTREAFAFYDNDDR